MRITYAEDANSTTRTQVPAQHEARMPKEDCILILKNGATASVRGTLADCIDLRLVLRRHPHHFDALLSLLQTDGRSSLQSNDARLSESIVFLRKRAYLDDDGRVRARIRNAVESSYQVTSEGPVITQPFLLASDAEKASAERIEQQMLSWLVGGSGDLFKDDEKNGPSR